MKQLSSFGMIGIGAVGVKHLAIVIGSFVNYFRSPFCATATATTDASGNQVQGWAVPGCLWYEATCSMEDFGEVPKAISIFIFSFAIVGTLPSVRAQMAE